MHSRSNSFPRIVLSDGTLELLKFLAIILMTLDHVNRFLLGGSMPVFSLAGRLAFPLFAFILGWNLARPGLLESGTGNRVLKRLFLFGVAATFPWILLLNFQWWELNILFTLWAGTAIVMLLNRRDHGYIALAAVLFLAAGYVVDYRWYGIAACVSSWAFCRKPGWATFLIWIASFAALVVINGNFVALLAVPLLWIASNWKVPMPRFKNFFYWFYPLHLLVIGWLTKA